MADTLSKQELLALADFILLEANGPGKFTSMRFTHEKWMHITAALRLAAKPVDEGYFAKVHGNFVEYLADKYRNCPLEVADLCDGRLDRSGALLGKVRAAAVTLRASTT